MSWLETSRALRATPPSVAGLERLAAELGEPVSAVGPLHGGISGSVYALRTPTRRLVLKRLVFDDAAPLEWERLQVARAAPVPTPEPVAVDPQGEWFGVAALVITWLPGSTLHPPQPELLGRTLAAIHTTPIPVEVPDVLRRPALWATWEERVELPAGAVDAIRALQRLAPGEPEVLAHCDFHPGNVLAEGGALTGVIDWGNARLAPAGLDVAVARCDLAIDPGGDAPDRFLRAYEAASGSRVEHLELWDVLAAARAIEHGDGWVDAWTEAGMPMTAAQIRQAAISLADAALARRS